MENPVRYMIYSTIAFTLMNALAKYLSTFHPFQLVFFRSLTSCVLCLFYLRQKKISVWGNERKLLILRGIVGVASLSSFFYALRLMPFGSAVSIRYLAPVFAAMMGMFFLKEKVKPIQWLYFLMAFTGVVLLKGFDGRISLFGLGLVLFSALLIGVIYSLIRLIGTRDHPLVIINYFMMTGVLVGGLISFFNWQTPIGIEWLYLLGLGIAGFIGQIYMTEAFQLERASKIAPITYFEVVCSLGFGFFLFGESYGIISLLGIALIMLGMVLNVFVKHAED